MNFQVNRTWHQGFYFALVAMLFLTIAQSAEAQRGPGGGGPVASFKGQVTSFDGKMLSIKMANGEIAKIGIGKKSKISALNRIKFSDIHKGDFIASAGTLQKNGTLHAIEVRVWDSKSRHPREVFRKFKFGPDSRMTNASVDAVIGDITKRTFKVKTKDGEKIIFVPKDVPVMRPAPGTTKLLKPGANISVLARKGKDGKITALRISVGINGLVPPI